MNSLPDSIRASNPKRRSLRRRAAQSLVAVLVVLAAVGAAAPQTVSAPTVAPRIDLEVLLLGASSDHPDLQAWQADLEREGVPFETIVASAGHTPITASTLSGTLPDGTPEGKFQAVIAASGGLAFAASEWEAIEQYEKTFNIRQVTGNVYPSASYGLNTPPPGSSGYLDGVSGTLTATGRAVFPYLEADAPITMGAVGGPAIGGNTTWGYEATPISTANFDTLVSGPGGSAFVGIYTHADGVEELVETYAQNQYLLQDQLLRHGVIAWATRGVYFGDQRNYAETEVDDVFLADDVWDTTTHSTDTDPDHAVQMSPSDIDYAAAWSHLNDFRIDLAFNGSGVTDTSGGSGLLSEFTTTDLQTARPYAESFGWVNHTWDHQKLDQGCASSSFIRAEVNENNNWALSALGLTEATDPGQALGYIDFGALVTGEHSGLANLVPGFPGTVDPPAFNTVRTSTYGGGTLPAGTYTFAITDQFSVGGGESSPSEAEVTLTEAGSVTLTWDAVCHAAAYKIYRQDMGTSAWSLVATIPAPTTEPPNDSFGDPYSTSSVAGGGPLEQTFTDSAADGEASAGPPATNSAVESAYQQNTQLDTALAILGVGAIAADASKPYPDPADATFPNGSPPADPYAAGATFSLAPGADTQAVPRWPTNIFYNASTAAQEIDEFETLYVLPTCVDTDVTTCYPEGTTFTIGEIVDQVVNANTGMFAHLMNNDPRPTYLHQSNLIGGSTGLFYSTLNELLAEYDSYFSVPIVQPTLGQAGLLLADQSAWSTNTSVSGYIQGNQVTITNSGATTDVPLTGITGVGTVYGGTRSGWAGIPSGTSTYTAEIAWPAPRTMTVQLAPASIVADHTSQSTATVTVTNSDGYPIVAEIPTIASTDVGQTIGAVTDHGDGTYTATITSSTTVGASTITATDTAVAPNVVSAEATLTQTAGSATTVTLQLSPSSIVADGTSTSTATATVTDAQGHPVAGQQVSLASTDSGQNVGTVTDHGDGTYTATITSSTTVGASTITAKDASVTPNIVSPPATLTQTVGPAAAVTLQLSPSSIVANGSSTSTATATVTDAHGHPVAGEQVSLASTDSGQNVGTVTDHGDGTYTATITSSTTVGASTITAKDASVTPNIVSPPATLTQTVGPAAAVTLQLSPSSIVANGSSTSTAIATVTDAQGHPVAGQQITLHSTDSGQNVGTVTDHGDGTYTATITSSTTVGSPAITATDTSVAPNIVSQPATLTQTAGAPTAVALQLSPSSIVANGTSTSTATATVTDAHGNPVAGQQITLHSTDSGQQIGPVTDHANGTYTATITGSTTAGSSTITAKDASVIPNIVSPPAALTQIAGPAAKVTLQLSPSSIVANGTSTSTANATVTDAHGNPVAGHQVTLQSTDSGQKIGPVTNHGDGTYTATITSSTTVGSPAITATDTSVAPNIVSQPATLTQTVGPAAKLTLQLSPSSVVADGSSTSTATATVSDAQGRPLAGQQVTLASNDSGQKIGTVTDHGDGTYTATITSSKTVHQVTITATDASVSAQAVLTQTAAPSPTTTTTGTSTTSTTTTPTLAPATPRSSSRIDVIAPKVTIRNHTLAKVKKKVAVKLSCPRNQSFCAGVLSLKVKGGAHKNLALGKHRFNLAGGNTGTVKLVPPKQSVQKLRKAVSTRVAVTTTARNKAGLARTSGRRMTLYLKLDRKKPIVRIARGPLTYAAAPVAIQLTCPGSQTYCRGTVSLTARPAAHKAILLGKSGFRIARDVTATVKIKLRKAAIAKLGKKARVKVAIKATARNRLRHQGTARRKATLLLQGTGTGTARWLPPRNLSWYWQLQGTIDNGYGAAAYDIDGFDNSAAEVAKLHAAGKHVICYIDVGTWENWRSDAGKFPDAVLGKSNGWPGERWLDIRQQAVRKLMAARFQMCKQKGFDAIEPDNIDGYQNDTGFPLTAEDQLNYDKWIASKAHSLGLAVFQKNDPDQAALLEPYFDGALAEQCNQYKECSSYAPYLRAGKPVLNAEYNLSTSQFCPSDNAAGIMGARYDLNLDGSLYEPCWSGNPGSTSRG